MNKTKVFGTLVMLVMIVMMTSMVEARTMKAVKKVNSEPNFMSSGCDMTGDGITNLSDVSFLASFVYSTRTDLNGDGVFNLSDISILAKGIYTPGWCASTFASMK